MDHEKGLALWNAVIRKNLAEVKSLLNSKADPNYLPTKFHRPVLCVAVEYNTFEMVQELLQAGAIHDIYTRSVFYHFPSAGSNIYNILLHYGARLTLEDKELFNSFVKRSYNVEQITRISALLTAHDIMCERVARCRKTCIALWAAPFQQRDLKVWWIRMVVWPTRHEAVWTPDRPMPEGYT